MGSTGGRSTAVLAMLGYSVIETGPDEAIYPVAKIATIVEILAAEGMAPAAALKDSRLTPSALPLPRTRVSLNQIIQCCRNAIALSRDPFFAYRAGLRFHVSTQGMLRLGVSSPISSGTQIRSREI